ncbi:helix-turn-helix transcriptional regulator [Bacillus sp. H-16]|uniref:helix-turn-helix transcriptional regulator n=1 Tax=Alteribacter salitolerans TaxID=2912333 RepID=UPI001965503A|nr:helix-turn-helix transcriptional regulator [Alteribacter salitolerans]MBM7096137.1 helix-turn-helix transcriptional regulator [Alteribacter salitolerans]
MSDPLKGLKKAMDGTVFREVRFSDKQARNIIKETSASYIVNKPVEESMAILLLQSLESGPLSGYSIFKAIRHKREAVDLEAQEGQLYILLHRLEQKRLIGSQWQKDENGEQVKEYILMKKGTRILMKWEKADDQAERRSLQLHLEGGLV